MIKNMSKKTKQILTYLGKKIPNTNLTLLEELGLKPYHNQLKKFYKVLCDCGKTVEIHDTRLKTCGSNECLILKKRLKAGQLKASIIGGKVYGEKSHKKSIILENKEHQFYLVNYVYQTYIKGAKNNEREWCLTPQDIEALWIKQEGKCAQTGLKLTCGTNGYNHTWSLDRIDNNKHYTIDNVQIVTKFYNMVKVSRTDKELKTLAYLLYQNLSIEELRKFNSMSEKDFQDALKYSTRTSRKIKVLKNYGRSFEGPLLEIVKSL